MAKSDDDLAALNSKLAVLLNLNAYIIAKGMTVAQGAPILKRLGLTASEIAAVFDSTPKAVNVRLAEAKKKETASAAKEIIGAALEAGVAPVVFDGWEADPAAYVDANFVSLESFRSHVDKLCAVGPKVPGKPTSSGKASDHSDADKTAELSVEEKAVFQKVGLGTEFVNIDNEAEARDAFNKAQAKKAAQK